MIRNECKVSEGAREREKEILQLKMKKINYVSLMLYGTKLETLAL